MRKNIKQVIIELMKEKSYSPLKINELYSIFGNTPLEKKILAQSIRALKKTGKIIKDSDGKYSLQNKSKGNLKGILRVNQRGFGFVTVEGREEDIFIPSKNMNSALDKDTVIVKIINSTRTNSKEEGVILGIEEHHNKTIVGEYEESNGFGFVIPDDRRLKKDVYIHGKFRNNAKKGDIVVVEILNFNKSKNPEGKITKILGDKNNSATQLDSIILQNGILSEFPKKVKRQSDRINSLVTEADIVGRVDLRNEIIFTIDDITSMDLDDAISIEKKAEGYKLGVHIADVTNYVTEDSALDREALKRGTSIYLVDRVIPMLPQKLSNGICSLNPGEDRLTLSCNMEFDNSGKLVNYNIFTSVIKSIEKLNYTDVSDLIENVEDKFIEKQELRQKLIWAAELSELLEKKRIERGEIDFDFQESKIIMENGIVIDIHAEKNRTANKIIESFMLVANETVAECYKKLELPFVYRIHEYPDKEKIENLGKFLSTFGLNIEYFGDTIKPSVLQKITEEIKGKDYNIAASTALLRSLKQAKYSTKCEGHFGLGADYYCHFTSPIRRYPDLQIHRIIKEHIEGKLTEERIHHYETIIESVADNSSKQERKAEELERTVEDLRKTQYMSKFINEEFLGTITSVTNFGMFVELDNSVEGLVRINELVDDYYIHDKENYRLIGERTNKQYRIGTKVKVKVKGTNVATREIDFDLI